MFRFTPFQHASAVPGLSFPSTKARGAIPYTYTQKTFRSPRASEDSLHGFAWSLLEPKRECSSDQKSAQREKLGSIREGRASCPAPPFIPTPGQGQGPPPATEAEYTADPASSLPVIVRTPQHVAQRILSGESSEPRPPRASGRSRRGSRQRLPHRSLRWDQQRAEPGHLGRSGKPGAAGAAGRSD